MSGKNTRDAMITVIINSMFHCEAFDICVKNNYIASSVLMSFAQDATDLFALCRTMLEEVLGDVHLVEVFVSGQSFELIWFSELSEEVY